MTKLYILLAQSVTGSVIIIVLLLLVAALIGYLTSWFYAKSVYTPVIKGLEDSRRKLSKEVDWLTAEAVEMKEKVTGLEAKVKKLEDQIEEKDRELSGKGSH